MGQAMESPLSSGLSEALRSLGVPYTDPLARSVRWGSSCVAADLMERVGCCLVTHSNDQMTDGEHWPAMPTDEELTRISGALITAGRNALPVNVEGAPLESANPRRDLVHIEADEPAFVRMWLAALLHRMLDGYEATLTS